MRNPMAEMHLRAARWKARFPGSRTAQAGASFARRIAESLFGESRRVGSSYALLGRGYGGQGRGK